MSYTSAVRAAIGSISPQTLVTDVLPAEALVRRAEAGTRFSLTLIAVFAAAAAVLVAVGLYGCTHDDRPPADRRNRRPHGPGCLARQILRLVIGHGLRLTPAECARPCRCVRPDPCHEDNARRGHFDRCGHVSRDGLRLLPIAAVSSWLPARKAAALDPAAALRGD